MRPELKTYTERDQPPAWKDDGADAAPKIPAIDRHNLQGK